MPQIYRIGNDIYDANTGQKVSNPQQLVTNYKGATEINIDGTPKGQLNTGIKTTTPNTVVRPGAVGLSSWQAYQSLKDAAANIIKMKTGNNADITNSSAYVGALQKDTSPFGGQTAINSNLNLSDASLRELSPADQASIRASRDAALSGINNATSNELAYRNNTTGTAMSNLKDIYDENRQASALELQKEQLANEKEQQEQEYRLKLYQAGLGAFKVDEKTGKLVPVDTGSIFNNPDGTTVNLTGYAADPDSWGSAVKTIFSDVPTYQKYDNAGKSSQYNDSFDAYLARKAPGSALLGHGEDINRAAAKYGISPELLLSIAIHESAWGTSGVTKKDNNLGGITWNSNFPESMKGTPRPKKEGGYYVKFDNVADSIDQIAKTADKLNKQNSGDSTYTKKNTYSPDDLKTVSTKTGVPITDLLKFTDQQISDSLRASTANNQDPISQLLDTTAGLNLQARNPKLNKSQIATLWRAYNMGDKQGFENLRNQASAAAGLSADEALALTNDFENFGKSGATGTGFLQ